MGHPGERKRSTVKKDLRGHHSIPQSNAYTKGRTFQFSKVVERWHSGSFLVAAERIAAVVHTHNQASQLTTYHRYRNPTFHSSSG